MLHGDPAHGTVAPVVEAAKLGEEVPTEAPHLTSVEQNRQHEDRKKTLPLRVPSRAKLQSKPRRLLKAMYFVYQ